MLHPGKIISPIWKGTIHKESSLPNIICEGLGSYQIGSFPLFSGVNINKTSLKPWPRILNHTRHTPSNTDQNAPENRPSFPKGTDPLPTTICWSRCSFQGVYVVCFQKSIFFSKAATLKCMSIQYTCITWALPRHCKQIKSRDSEVYYVHVYSQYTPSRIQHRYLK